MSLVVKKVGTDERIRHSLDGPCPTLMADGLGGVCRRGGQYWMEAPGGMMPADLVPGDGSPVDTDGELEMVKVWVERQVGLLKDSVGARYFPGTAHEFIDCTDRPAPSIVAGRPVHIVLEDDGMDAPTPDQAKPPYRVPTMEEIRELPWNGLTAASTFSGTGGSSLGYRMAGYRVLYANEFVEAARESYRSNAADYTYLDDRDIRAVTAEDILEKCGLGVGELDLFDGSPPCSDFSTAGKRSKGWGKEKAYSDDKVQRVDDLFFEYARLVGGIQPKVFVAENVSGLIKGTAKGYFLEILAALKACGPGYRVSARLLDAQWLGVPQARQRLIFVGVRSDLDVEPVHPKPLPYRYSIRDALPWISRMSAEGHGYFEGGDRSPDLPAPTIATSPGSAAYNGHKVEIIHGPGAAHSSVRGEPVDPDQPAPTILAGGDGPHGRRDRTDQFEVAAPGYDGPLRAAEIAAADAVVTVTDPVGRVLAVDEDGPLPTIRAGSDQRARTDQFEVRAPEATLVLGGDANPNKPGNSFPRGARIGLDEPCPTIMASNGIIGSAPHALEMPPESQKIGQKESVAEHIGASLEGYAIGAAWDKLAPGQKSDKYLNLVRPDADRPCPTVTASGGGGNGAGVPGSTASVTHPTEKRKFSIAELRRLGGFPDDFILTGSYGQQWERIGRAVPPVMMFHIAAVIRDEVLAKVPR